MIHELLVLGLLAFAILLIDLWLPVAAKRKLGCVAASGLGLILIYSCLAIHTTAGATSVTLSGRMYALDSFTLFFKRFFLIAAILVFDYVNRIRRIESLPLSRNIYALILFALAGMICFQLRQ